MNFALNRSFVRVTKLEVCSAKKVFGKGRGDADPETLPSLRKIKGKLSPFSEKRKMLHVVTTRFIVWMFYLFTYLFFVGERAT